MDFQLFDSGFIVYVEKNMKKILILIFPLSLLTSYLVIGCSQSQNTVGKNIIKTTNVIKGIKNTTTEGLKEKVIFKTKDILDPSRGGGVL